MRIILKIKRYNPESGRGPYEQTYETTANPTDRILNVLIGIKHNSDLSLSFRKSCAHGVCGSDAMRINGKERLACKTLVQDVAEKDGAIITIEPLRHFPVERDLIVQQSSFFDKYRTVKPFLINKEPPQEKERIQSAEQRSAFADPTSCILCLACFSACPVFDENINFIGPAIIAQAFRFNEDNRDHGFDARRKALDTPDGIWACENRFECTRNCPRGIKITKRINQTKKRISQHKETP